MSSGHIDLTRLAPGGATTGRRRRRRWVAFLLAWLVAAPVAAADDDWAEWTYRWEQLTIVVRTNAGVYSPALQAVKINSPAAVDATGPINLMWLARAYFVSTSAPRPRVNHTFEFIESLSQQFGRGHALPILAAIAVENVQRPIPTLFGGSVSTWAPSSGGEPRETTAGGIDPQRPAVLRITIHGDSLGFRRAAEQAAHASAKAYYDGRRNEVGLLLDMPRFQRFYGSYEKRPNSQPEILSAFIAYAMEAFNEDSGHELAHAYQQQTQRAAYYALPVIREGEAEVQGMVRRRDGLIFNFLYNTPDYWLSGVMDRTTVEGRIKTIDAAGRPMSPEEIDRLVTLKALRRAGRALTTAQLLGMNASAFFAGSAADIESRYAQAWALCLLALREPQSRQTLMLAIDARVAKQPRVELEAELDKQIARFIDDPHGLKVTKEKAWEDAEYFYKIDPVFVGVFYAWIHAIDPGDMKALVYLGDALFKGSNLHAAMRYYLAAQRLDSGSALPLLRVGDVQDQMGNREDALRTWRDAEATNGVGQVEASYRRLAKERPANANR
jgi:tetratricopeptide (TPR) repeat protein